jgi:hypothetical protein
MLSELGLSNETAMKIFAYTKGSNVAQTNLDDIVNDLVSTFKSASDFRLDKRYLAQQIYLYGLPDNEHAVYEYTNSLLRNLNKPENAEELRKRKYIQNRVGRFLKNLQDKVDRFLKNLQDKFVDEAQTEAIPPQATVPASVPAISTCNLTVVDNAEDDISDITGNGGGSNSIDNEEDDIDESLAWKLSSSFLITEKTDFTGIIKIPIPIDLDAKIMVIGDALKKLELESMGFRRVTFVPEQVDKILYDVVFHRKYLKC